MALAPLRDAFAGGAWAETRRRRAPARDPEPGVRAEARAIRPITS